MEEGGCPCTNFRDNSDMLPYLYATDWNQGVRWSVEPHMIVARHKVLVRTAISSQPIGRRHFAVMHVQAVLRISATLVNVPALRGPTLSRPIDNSSVPTA